MGRQRKVTAKKHSPKVGRPSARKSQKTCRYTSLSKLSGRKAKSTSCPFCGIALPLFLSAIGQK